MGDANETDGPVPARRVKRLLLICFVMSLAGTIIGAVVKELAEQHRMAGAIVPVLGVLAGVLFIAGPCVVFVFWLRWQMPTAFQNFDREGLTGRDRRAVVRAISRGREVPVEHRAAGLRMARRMGSQGYWSVWWLLYLALLYGFNAVTQTGLMRILWIVLLCCDLAVDGYCYRLTRRAQHVAEQGFRSEP